jgi:hypothetical protein
MLKKRRSLCQVLRSLGQNTPPASFNENGANIGQDCRFIAVRRPAAMRGNKSNRRICALD